MIQKWARGRGETTEDDDFTVTRTRKPVQEKHELDHSTPWKRGSLIAGPAITSPPTRLSEGHLIFSLPYVAGITAFAD